MQEVYKLVGQIVEQMQQHGCPSEAAERAERALVSIIVNTMRPVIRAEEAAALLPFGASSAALVLGVHRSTVYRRKNRRVEPVQSATAD